MPTIGFIGTRGIPNGHGGFERFIELIVGHPGWLETEFRFKVYGELPDRIYNPVTELRQVGVIKDQSPLGYYFRSTVLATRECDIIVCCGVGISAMAYWPRLRGKTLVVNPDGCEWRRTKWSGAGRLAIRAMYAPALAAARYVVIDAEALRKDFNLGSKGRYIAYSAPPPKAQELSDGTRTTYGLKRPYALVIARLEPENNVQMAVDAFVSLADPTIDLIVIGNTSTAFFKANLASKAAPNLRFLGGVYDQDALNELRSSCSAYFHGHSVGGTNPSLLEALATVRGRLICFDSKYNREVAGKEATYVGSSGELTESLRKVAADPGLDYRTPTRDDRFHPDTIFDRYKSLFEEADASH